MNPWRWFPAFRPPRPFEAVVRELIDGLRDGSIVLDRHAPAPNPAPEVPPDDAPAPPERPNPPAVARPSGS